MRLSGVLDGLLPMSLLLLLCQIGGRSIGVKLDQGPADGGIAPKRFNDASGMGSGECIARSGVRHGAGVATVLLLHARQWPCRHKLSSSCVCLACLSMHLLSR